MGTYSHRYINPRVNIMREAQQRVSKNSYGLPEGIFRADLIPQTPPSFDTIPDPLDDEPTNAQLDQLELILDQEPNQEQESNRLNLLSQEEFDLLSREYPEVLQTEGLEGPLGVSDFYAPENAYHPAKLGFEDELRAAYVPLDYSPGYPMLPGGLPFWGQLPWEPADDFKIFEEYLHQAVLGQNRQLDILTIRAASAEDVAFQLNKAELEERFYLYWWNARAMAFDIFRATSLSRQRAFEAHKLENNHLKAATEILDRALERIIGNEDDEFWETASPKVIVELVKNMMQVQRVSLGLPGSGPPQGGSQGGHGPANPAGVEVIMRNLTATPADPKGSIDPLQIQGKGTGGSGINHIKTLLADADAVQMAQELIIRMHPPAQPNQ